VESLSVPPGGSPAEQCRLLLAAVSAWLETLAPARTLADAIFAELQVSDLACFEAVNAEYAKAFRSQPPARVCIQTPLPEALHLRLRLLLREASSTLEAQSLRVQSISTWAMACIGPYSQAFRVGPLLFSAGVLGLIPHSMVLPTAAQAAVALPASDVAELAQWEAELWLLMRSLLAVLAEMGHKPSNVRMARIYTSASGIDSCRAICAAVLRYFGSHPEGAPLMAFAAVPRLPKDGCVEVQVVCASDEEPIPAVRTLQCCGGTVTAAIRCLGGSGTCRSWTCMVEFQRLRDVLLEDVAQAAAHCGSLLQEALLELTSEVGEAISGLNMGLEVQYSSPQLNPRSVEEVVGSAVRSCGGCFDGAAVSFMPVLSLGAHTRLRFLALVGPTGP